MSTELKYLEIETSIDEVGNYRFNAKRRGFAGAWKVAMGLFVLGAKMALFGYARGQLYQPLFVREEIKEEAL